MHEGKSRGGKKEGERRMCGEDKTDGVDSCLLRRHSLDVERLGGPETTIIRDR